MPLLRSLGLDIGTYTGWAIAEDGIIRKGMSGVRDFSAARGQHNGHRGVKFYNFLHCLGRVDEIYFEKVFFGGRGKHPGDFGDLYKGFIMLMDMYAAGFGVPTYPVYPSSLKLQFTGSGHAEKKDMCARAHALGWNGGLAGTPLHDDEADAVALLITQIPQRHGMKCVFG